MPRVGFELTIPAFERAKPIHALDSADTVIYIILYAFHIFYIRATRSTYFKPFPLNAFAVSDKYYKLQVYNYVTTGCQWQDNYNDSLRLSWFKR
jgi:hypothetical protein